MSRCGCWRRRWAGGCPQRVVVENRPGAGSILGTEAVARGPKDGSVFLTATVAHAVNPALYRTLSFDPVADFRGVGLIGTVPLLLVVPAASPAKDLAGLLAMLRERPGGHDYGSAGNGSAQHLGAELLQAMAGVQVNHIPYRGNPTALTDLAAGRLTFVVESMATTLPQVRGGTLRALAVTAPERVPLAPEIPTVAETIPGYAAWTWNAILAPAGHRRRPSPGCMRRWPRCWPSRRCRPGWRSWGWRCGRGSPRPGWMSSSPPRR